MNWFKTKDDEGNDVLFQWSQVKVVKVTPLVVTIWLDESSVFHFHAAARSSMLKTMEEIGIWK